MQLLRVTDEAVPGGVRLSLFAFPLRDHIAFNDIARSSDRMAMWWRGDAWWMFQQTKSRLPTLKLGCSLCLVWLASVSFDIGYVVCVYLDSRTARREILRSFIQSSNEDQWNQIPASSRPENEIGDWRRLGRSEVGHME